MQHFAKARILVVDDEPNVLDAYRHVLKTIVRQPTDDVMALADKLFGSQEQALSTPTTTIAAVDFCRQGEDAVRQIEEKLIEGNVYPLAFVDIRMPPGIDGLETAKRLRRLHPMINIVVVTGYSDHPPHRIAEEVGSLDRLFYLVKPFNPDELLHLAVTLIHRWNTEQITAEKIATTTSALDLASAAARENEAKARQLEKRIKDLVDQLQHRSLTWEDRVWDSEPWAAGDPKQGEIFRPDVRAAFVKGSTVASRSGSLSLCPYSATKEAELFAAWIAGFRSVTD